jgi:hypothetical protein
VSDPNQGATAGPPRAALGGDFIIPALACALTGYYFVSTLDLDWEAKATGLVIGLVLLALCAIQFARLGMRVVGGRGSLSLGDLVENNLFNRQRLGLIALVALYVVTIYWVGATVGLFFLLVASMRLLGVTRIRTLIAVAFTSAAIVHLALIVLLDSKLPRGLLLDWLASALGAR